MKENLGQGGFYTSRAKLEKLPLISLEKWQFFQFWLYFSICPSLKSGFPIH